MKPIIFADDEPYEHQRITKKLKDRLSELCIDDAWDGEELIEKVRTGDYALIVTDFNMGARMDGLTASKRIRELGIETPIYLHSSGGYEKGEPESSGITGVFGKGFGTKDLVDAVVEFYQSQKS